MFWRATLAIAALYYVTVPAVERQQTESQLRAAASQVPAQALDLCQEKPLLCADAMKQAGTLLAPATMAPARPAASPGEPHRQIVEGLPLPPRRPAPGATPKGA